MRFKFKATFEWTENVVDSGSLLDKSGNQIGYRCSNETVLEALKRWHLELGPNGVSDLAHQTIKIKRLK